MNCMTLFLRSKKWSNSPTRDLELAAVARAIETVSGADPSRLNRIKRGFKSSMAANANPRDGFTKPAKKKA